MSKSLRDDFGTVSNSRGLFVGQLNDAELAAFDRLTDAGVAFRSYEGAAGFMGLATVQFYPNASHALTRLEASEPEQ